MFGLFKNLIQDMIKSGRMDVPDSPISLAEEPVPVAPIEKLSLVQPVETVSEPDTARSLPEPGASAISVPLADLMESWPPDLRAVLASGEWANTSVAIPIDEIEAGIKSGKVSMSWPQIAAWIDPRPPALASKEEWSDLSLPLSTLVPLFFAARPRGAPRAMALR